MLKAAAHPNNMRHIIQMTNPRLAGAVELAFVDQQ
jgi:hypothetical protein